MTRCLELANLGKGHVAPNPMVGAVLVHNGRIIGEGYHEQYGLSHAEVNCINNVKEKDKILISQSIMYVSLEPCAHFGKTPPCSELIIRHKIPKVVIGCRDPFKEVNGKGIEKLLKAGIEVQTGVLEEECMLVNKRFFTFHNQGRPYIILKWAQTSDNKIASNTDERLFISNQFSNRRVHQWRSEESAILIGTNTALLDNPLLTNRLWTGNSPARLLIDMHLRLPTSLHIFNQQQKTVIFNAQKQGSDGNNLYYQIREDKNVISQIINACYQLAIQSVIVEGGAGFLQSFINENSWDEARIITNDTLRIGEGLSAPDLKHSVFVNKEKILNNTIQYFRHE
jgi:diaminohydroxyphosphoribosylaminopyrimidine deaminase/5-amino-6-(5-phosphoribosylamino)uracil reductase